MAVNILQLHTALSSTTLLLGLSRVALSVDMISSYVVDLKCIKDCDRIKFGDYEPAIYLMKFISWRLFCSARVPWLGTKKLFPVVSRFHLSNLRISLLLYLSQYNQDSLQSFAKFEDLLLGGRTLLSRFEISAIKNVVVNCSLMRVLRNCCDLWRVMPFKSLKHPNT